MADETYGLTISGDVTEIDAFAYAEDRTVTSVSFPEGLKKIGAHAFYNCRSLYRIRLGSSDTDIGDGAFKNCERLKEIEIVKNGGIKSLKAVLFDAHRQVRVRLIYPDGEALLVFPYFMDNFEENTPARIVMHISEGAGTPYRECIYSGDVDYKAYDALFNTGINLDIYDSAAEIAVCRLRFPYKLSDGARETYESFIKENVTRYFSGLLTDNKTEAINELLQLDIIDKEMVSGMIDDARQKNRPEAVAVLMERYGKMENGRKKRYEF